MTQTNNEREALIQLLNATATRHGQYDDKAISEARKIATNALEQSPISQNEQPKQIPEGWISVEERLPELEDNSVLAHFKNGSIETIHIEDYFKDITNGLDENNNQIYTKWYLHSDPHVTHWMPLPEAPTTSLTSETNTEVGND